MPSKPRIALLHGFAVGLTSPFVRPGLGPTVGFRAFREDVADGSARVFPWGSYRNVKLHELVNPLFLYRHYLTERAMAFDRATQKRLHDFFVELQPDIIVCHSMGSVLLHEYLAHFSLPNSVRAIVFVQSELPTTTHLATKVPVYNIFCLWDLSLLASALVHWHWRVGLGAWKHPGVTNIFFPLFRVPNLHMSSMRSPKLRELVLQILADTEKPRA